MAYEVEFEDGRKYLAETERFVVWLPQNHKIGKSGGPSFEEFERELRKQYGAITGDKPIIYKIAEEQVTK